MNVTKPQFPAHLVAFTEDILNGKLHFFVQCQTIKCQKDPGWLGLIASFNLIKI